MSIVCVWIVRMNVCSPQANAIVVPRAIHEAQAATLIIPLFIGLKLADYLVDFDVLAEFVPPKYAIAGAVSPAVKLVQTRSILGNKNLFLNRRCTTDKQSQSLPFFMLNSRVSVNLAVLGTLLLLANGALEAADSSRPLDIRVLPDGFGTASSEDITALLQSTAFELWKHCPQTQLSGIDVYHRTDHPQTNFKRTPGGRIAIGLAAQDTHWAQYGFQFAHEFCHTLANFSNNPQRLMRYPTHANFWLEESLCETASLFTLRAMSRSWQVAPPYPAWREYAPWLSAYADRRLTLPEHRLPPGASFLVWFHAHQPALRQNSTIREWNTIIAIRLLPVFEAEPGGWEAVSFLNRGSPDTNESLAQHLAKWRSQCPANLRPFVSKLAAVFAVKL
jgi:hypothetical protein